MPIKFRVFGGGGGVFVFFFLWGSANFIFVGAGIFLIGEKVESIAFGGS